VVLQRLQSLRIDDGYWIDTGIFTMPSALFGHEP